MGGALQGPPPSSSSFRARKIDFQVRSFVNISLRRGAPPPPVALAKELCANGKTACP